MHECKIAAATICEYCGATGRDRPIPVRNLANSGSPVSWDWLLRPSRLRSRRANATAVFQIAFQVSETPIRLDGGQARFLLRLLAAVYNWRDELARVARPGAAPLADKTVTPKASKSAHPRRRRF
jgi:hypothetical protein